MRSRLRVHRRRLTRWALLAGLMLSASLPASADTRIGITVSARGFFAAGIEAEYDVADNLVARVAVELPVAFVFQVPGIPAGRLALGVEPQWTVGRWRFGVAPDLVFVWHNQELGRYKSVQLAANVTASWTGPAGGSIGTLLGLETALLTWIAPSEYVRGAFDGTGQRGPRTGWYRCSMFNARMGVTASSMPLGSGTVAPVLVDGAIGVRMQPLSVAPPFSGFPYGNLPFFLEIRTFGTASGDTIPETQ